MSDFMGFVIVDHAGMLGPEHGNQTLPLSDISEDDAFANLTPERTIKAASMLRSVVGSGRFQAEAAAQEIMRDQVSKSKCESAHREGTLNL